MKFAILSYLSFILSDRSDFLLVGVKIGNPFFPRLPKKVFFLSVRKMIRA